MSKSNPKIQNPCQKFIEIKSDKGKLVYFDKETEKQVEIPLPVYFIVLDELSTISGFNKKHDCGVYSNEVHSTVDEILRVKTFKGGESITGKYADIKLAVNALGGKFTKSVYAMLINKNPGSETYKNEMVNFKFRGSSFASWMDKKFNPDNYITAIIGFNDETNGVTNYKVPVFSTFKLKPELNSEAVEMDKILQAYLKEYKSQVPEKEIAKTESDEVYIPENEPRYETNEAGIVQDENDLPF